MKYRRGIVQFFTKKQRKKWNTHEDATFFPSVAVLLAARTCQGRKHAFAALLSLSQKMAVMPPLSAAAGVLEYPLTAEPTRSFCIELKHHLTLHLNASTSPRYKSDTYYLLKEMGEREMARKS